ncbi:hypothetical protein [Methylobacterium sp. Leaf399]|uniref:hypothetical protein n=1 Tax=Methylobacterium sp. Leaf399 TaxID=1736364 RepID=UPI000ABD0582|nr:hypothetical protein [Methylobacterium sp. Leaf399]
MGETKTMRCDACRHWGNEVTHVELGFMLRECNAVPMLWDATEYKRADDEDPCSYGRVLLDEYKNTMAFVQDGSDYKALVYTKPEFFCANFEPATEA